MDQGHRQNRGRDQIRAKEHEISKLRDERKKLRWDVNKKEEEIRGVQNIANASEPK